MKKDNEEFPIRINKYLAMRGYSTRRASDELIKSNQVLINGDFAEPGQMVQRGDNVEVRLKGKPKTYVYFAYNKPRGIISHSGDEKTKDIKGATKGKNELKDLFPVGRLDKDSSGLMILTNDGRITDRLLNPKFSHEKEYTVTTKQKLRNNFKQKMEAGVKIEDEMTAPCKVQILGETKFKVVLGEGKKHQIRRMCVALFQDVLDLKRTRIMNINLGNLALGAHRKIEGEELSIFLKSLGL